MLMLPKKSFWTTSFPSSRTDRLKFQKQSQKCLTLILLTKNVIIIIEKGRKLHFLEEAPQTSSTHKEVYLENLWGYAEESLARRLRCSS